jgi:hypothetical protein
MPSRTVLSGPRKESPGSGGRSGFSYWAKFKNALARGPFKLHERAPLAIAVALQMALHGVQLPLSQAFSNDDDATQTSRRADFGVETPLDEGALEEKGVGQRGEQPLDRHVEAMGGRAWPVIEAPAVRRIGPDSMRG